jgi:hypothetical protein
MKSERNGLGELSFVACPPHPPTKQEAPPSPLQHHKEELLLHMDEDSGAEEPKDLFEWPNLDYFLGPPSPGALGEPLDLTPNPEANLTPRKRRPPQASADDRQLPPERRRRTSSSDNSGDSNGSASSADHKDSHE